MTSAGTVSIVQVARVASRLVPHRWLWAEENAARIAAHWDERRSRSPALFDGRVLMVAATRAEAGTLSADFFETAYSNLLAHADLGFPDSEIRNGFAMGALQGSDGGFLLGEMAGHTANAGRLYFPAGTPDLSDVRPDGTVDLAASILREIREETGLAPGADALSPNWTIVRHEGRIAFMRDVLLPIPAETARERIRVHLAADPEPELSGIHVVRSVADIDRARMPGFLPAYLEWALARVQR